MDLNRPLSVVAPTLDGDVLAILATHTATFTTGQIHRILSRNSVEGIRKVLHRLVKQGIVHSEQIGNAFAYRFNHDHLAAEYIVGLARLRETFLARLEDHLKSWQATPVYAAVFGSAARGSMTVDSDVDLLLVRPNDLGDTLWETQVDNLVATASRWLGNDIRPLEFTANEIAKYGRREPVLNDVWREGLTVAGHRSWLTKQLHRENV